MPYEIDASSKCGADYTFNPSKVDLEDSIRHVTDGDGASAVIEATASPEVLPIALRLATERGRVVLLGSTRGESTMNFYREVHRRGVVVIGAHNRIRPRYESVHGYWTIKDDMAIVLKLLSKGLLKVRDLITSKLSFLEAEKAYKKLIESKGDVLGIIFPLENVSF